LLAEQKKFGSAMPPMPKKVTHFEFPAARRAPSPSGNQFAIYKKKEKFRKVSFDECAKYPILPPVDNTLMEAYQSELEKQKTTFSPRLPWESDK